MLLASSTAPQDTTHQQWAQTHPYSCHNLQSYFRELLLGEVEWVIEGSDPISTGVFTLLEVGPKDGIVDHIQEGCNGMPPLVVKPHLQDTTSASERHQVLSYPKAS